MPVLVQCPNSACGKSFNVEEVLVGRTARCKGCGQHFTIQPAGASPPLPPLPWKGFTFSIELVRYSLETERPILAVQGVCGRAEVHGTGSHSVRKGWATSQQVLTYPPVTEELLGEVVRRIQAVGQPLQVILFGSARSR